MEPTGASVFIYLYRDEGKNEGEHVWHLKSVHKRVQSADFFPTFLFPLFLPCWVTRLLPHCTLAHQSGSVSITVLKQWARQYYCAVSSWPQHV
jgi:hypothetical protein